MTIQTPERIDPETRERLDKQYPGATEEAALDAISDGWVRTREVGRWLTDMGQTRAAAFRLRRELTDEESEKIYQRTEHEVSDDEVESAAAPLLLTLLVSGRVQRRTIRIGGRKVEYWALADDAVRVTLP